ncbi:MAG: creatininase family protein [bacterium]|nr:creatininase family protein [bacterium]
MRFQDLHWKDVESYLQHDNRVILVTGATEQHAYLSLMTDILIPSRIALAAAEREHVLIAPPLHFGVSGVFAEFPGTISLSQETFDQVLLEMVESLMHQGFSRFFILNGHGYNQPSARVGELHAEGIIQVDWYHWWRENAVKQVESEIGMTLDHANWGENFPFTRVGDLPPDVIDTVKPRINLEMIDNGQTMRQVAGDGSFGGPYQAPDAVMEMLFQRVVDEVCERLRALRD